MVFANREVWGGSVWESATGQASSARFAYDGSHHLTSHQIANVSIGYQYEGTAHTVATITLDAGSVWTLQAASLQGLAASPAEDASAAVGVLTDPLGHAYSYSYDLGGGRVQLVTP